MLEPAGNREVLAAVDGTRRSRVVHPHAALIEVAHLLARRIVDAEAVAEASRLAGHRIGRDIAVDALGRRRVRVGALSIRDLDALVKRLEVPDARIVAPHRGRIVGDGRRAVVDEIDLRPLRERNLHPDERLALRIPRVDLKGNRGVFLVTETHLRRIAVRIREADGIVLRQPQGHRHAGLGVRDRFRDRYRHLRAESPETRRRDDVAERRAEDASNDGKNRILQSMNCHSKAPFTPILAK